MKISFDRDVDRDFRVKVLIVFRPRTKYKYVQAGLLGLRRDVSEQVRNFSFFGKLCDRFLKLGVESLQVLAQARQVCRLLGFHGLFIASDFNAVGQLCYFIGLRAISKTVVKRREQDDDDSEDGEFLRLGSLENIVEYLIQSLFSSFFGSISDLDLASGEVASGGR